jgi:D-amino-acid dehydrogenase
MKCFCISEESVMPHVIVIGAGITGVTSAYELSQLGYQVTVIDRILSSNGNIICKWRAIICL